MSRKYLFIASGVLILILILIGYRVYKYNSVEPQNYQETGLSYDQESISEISLEDVTSRLFVQKLNPLETQNKLNELPERALPVETYSNMNPIFFEKHGYYSTGPFSTELQSSKYNAIDHIPYVLVSLYQTNIESDEYIIFFVKWLNKDKSIVFVPLIGLREVVLSDSYNKYFESLKNNDGDYFPSPIVKIRDMESCLSIYTAGKGYCDWYFKNLEEYKKLEEDWLVNDAIPKEVERLPLLFTFKLVNI